MEVEGGLWWDGLGAVGVVGGDAATAHTHTPLAPAARGTFFFFFHPFADVRRGARLLSPSPCTATLAQLRGPPLHSAPSPPSNPISGVHRSGGVGKVCCHALSGRLKLLPLAHVARRALQGFFFFFFFFFLAGAGRGVGGRAVRAEGRAAAFPWITSLVSQGRNLRGAPQTN